MSLLKVGLIGCGGIGAVHAHCWLALGDIVQLVAISDINQEKAQKIAGNRDIKIYEDGKVMLEEEELDVVDICLPTFLHTDYVLYAMEKVANIIVEKPICLKENEASQLLEVYEKTGALVQVAHVVRFTDAYAYLKELVDTGKYGSVIAAEFYRISPRPKWMKGHDDVDRTGTMALDMHIHDVDYIRYLMGGEPDDISTVDVRDDDGIIQHIWTAFRYGTAVLAAKGSWDFPTAMPFAAGFRVRLKEAAAVLDEKGVLTIYPEEGEAFVPSLGECQSMDMGINVSDMRPYMNEIRYFIKTILEKNRDGLASLTQAIASFELVQKELELVGGARKKN